jgi:hypothetical protein
MDERISTLNTVQLNSKKPFVDNEIAHFNGKIRAFYLYLLMVSRVYITGIFPIEIFKMKKMMQLKLRTD